MAATGNFVSSKRPVVLYPSPGMGHLVSMIELGKLFTARGLAVTVVVIDPPYNTGATAAFLDGVSSANPSMSFDRLPNVTLPPMSSPNQEALALELIRLSNPNLKAYLAGKAPAPAAIVIDFFCSVAADVGAELGIPTYYFFTSGGCSLAVFLHLPVFKTQLPKSFKDMGAELLHVPGVPPIPADHMPLPVLDRADMAYKGISHSFERMPYSAGIIVNTFGSLESRAIEAMAAGLCTPPGCPVPPVYCIGPLVKSQEVTEKSGKECLAWLDVQPKGSVVFLCFGSIGCFSAEQIKEVAIGVERSEQRFLWVVRSPPSSDSAKRFVDKPPEPDLDVLLPEGFLQRTGGRGLVAKSWAPQMDVLAHEAVGAFVTHCGWNSVLEAIVTGVPMITWPLYAEQHMNKVFLEEEMKLAVAVAGYANAVEVQAGVSKVVPAVEVEAKIRLVMSSAEGEELREKMEQTTMQATAALADGGESSATLDELVKLWSNC